MRNIGKTTNRLTVSTQDFLFGKSSFRFLKSITLLFIVILFVSCEDVFQVHPYDVRFNGETGAGEKFRGVYNSANQRL